MLALYTKQIRSSSYPLLAERSLSEAKTIQGQISVLAEQSEIVQTHSCDSREMGLSADAFDQLAPGRYRTGYTLYMVMVSGTADMSIPRTVARPRHRYCDSRQV